ncbi:MAG: glutathione S-transferase family protein [Tabrizicola sp.]|nr:glutathione S-transferase family protein [Tabrizicola sp.]
MIELHHLNNSRSQRVLWLLEELGVPYTVIRYERDPVTVLAPASLKAVHPLGKSPVIRDAGSVIAESGAIIEYLVERYGANRFSPPRGTAAFERYRYWMHYAEGSLMTQVMLRLYLTRIGEAAATWMERVVSNTNLHLDFVESELGDAPFLLGAEFSAADVQMSFPFEVARTQGTFVAERHPKLFAWLQRLRARPAYVAALQKCGPYAYGN